MVNPFKYILNKYFFVTPLFYSYGNAAEEILWAHARARLLKRKLVIIAPAPYTQVLGYTICNSELFNLDFGYKFNFFELFFKFLVSFIVNLIFFFKRLIAVNLRKYLKVTLHERYFFPQIGRYWFWPAHHIDMNNLRKYQEDLILKSLISINPPTVSAKNNAKEMADFKELMIQVDSKYVCLHVRDSGYFNDSSKRSYRNADINNYIPAIQMLIEQGITVIRIGSNSMQKCNFTNDKYIELYDSNFQSETLDLLLIQHCEFYIGMQSGPYDVALLFQKPILLLNMYACFFWGPIKQYDRGLLKSLVIKNEGEINSLKDRFNLTDRFNDIEMKLSKDEVTFIENSEFEILEASKLFYNEYLLGFKEKPNKNMLLNRDLYKSSSNRILEIFLSFDDSRPHENEINRVIYRELSSTGFFYCNSSFKNGK